MTKPTAIYQEISRDLLENFLWQHQVSVVAYDQAVRTGFHPGQVVQVQYQFDCPSVPAAEGLHAYLREQADDEITITANDSVARLAGTTAELELNLGLLLQWVGYMCDAGSQHQCRFDGWEPKRPMLIYPEGAAPILPADPHAGPLTLPDAIASDPEAIELCRIWTAQGAQTILLNSAALPDPAAWGIVAVDLMRHVGHAYHQLDGRDATEAYKRVLAGLMAEMQNPTD